VDVVDAEVEVTAGPLTSVGQVDEHVGLRIQPDARGRQVLEIDAVTCTAQPRGFAADQDDYGLAIAFWSSLGLI
jgi:hypothetical protein